MQPRLRGGCTAADVKYIYIVFCMQYIEAEATYTIFVGARQLNTFSIVQHSTVGYGVS